MQSLKEKRRLESPPVIDNHLRWSALSGLIWGSVVCFITLAYGFESAWGGLIVSPVVGVVIGLATPWWLRRSLSVRVISSLVLLYVAATLFGIGFGLYDWLVVRPNVKPWDVVIEAVLAVLFGLTFFFWVVVLWPLAYLNHSLLGAPRNGRW